MSAKNCPHCGRSVSNADKRIWCPHCEQRLKTQGQMEKEKAERIEFLYKCGKYDYIKGILESGDKKAAYKELMVLFGCDIVEALIILDEIELAIKTGDTTKPECKALRCRCGCVYPDDMDRCPSCGCDTNENIDNVLSKSDDRFCNSDASSWNPVRGGTYSYSQTNYKREPKNPNLTPCPACNHPISTQAESCPNCGQPTGVHVCPKCRSVNTKVISGASKAASVWMWGVFAANKVVSKYQCRDCGHKF